MIRSSRRRRFAFGSVALLGAMVAGGAAVAVGQPFSVSGGDNGGAALTCPRGMARLGHIFDENASIFPGDPKIKIKLAATIARDFFLVENVQTGTHASTHIDAPGHFHENGRTIDELKATEFVWPAYVIDVRGRMAEQGPDDFQLTQADIEAYEDTHGRIEPGSMVIIRTGFDQFFRTPAFFGAAPGFSGAAVTWLASRVEDGGRQIGGVGSDTFGPDATSDADFAATYNILAAEKVALPGLNNLGALQVKGDIIMASAVALRDGSGYQTDPLACLGNREPGEPGATN